MERFSIEKELEKTREHLKRIETGTKASDMDEVGKERYAHEIAETLDLGPNWPAETRGVDDVRKSRMGDISLIVDYMTRGVIPCEEKTLRQLLVEIDTLRSIENTEDAMLLKDIVEDFLKRLPEKKTDI